MYKLSTNNIYIYDERHDFLITHTVPNGYIVWNIPDINIGNDYYIPLCKRSEEYSVDLSSLLAIKVSDKKVHDDIKDLAIWGKYDEALEILRGIDKWKLKN